MSKQWSPDSWRELTALQQPNYPDPAAVEEVLAELSRLPPLVTSWEIESLKGMLADAANGKAFLLQGGDCAENFEECTSEAITSKLKILLQMSLVLVHGSKRRVIRVRRHSCLVGTCAWVKRPQELRSRIDVVSPRGSPPIRCRREVGSLPARPGNAAALFLLRHPLSWQRAARVGEIKTRRRQR